MPGSGKGTCVEYFTGKNLPSVYFGGMVYEEIEKRGLDRIADEKKVRLDMRQKEGLDVLAKRASQKAEDLITKGAQTIIFDGLYSWTEYKYLSEKFGDSLVVVAVVSNRKLRHQRILARKDGRNYTQELIIEREVSEIEDLEKGGPIAFADFYIINNGDINSLTIQLDDLSKKLGLS